MRWLLTVIPDFTERTLVGEQVPSGDWTIRDGECQFPVSAPGVSKLPI